MLEVPFGTGTAAALIFVIFELVVFPVLLASTTKLASFLAQAKARKGGPICVESMRFPVWSEGLLHRQWSHYFLLFSRILCVAIPVYLETRLESRTVPVLVPMRIENAFRVSPDDDWVGYQNRTAKPIIVLRENGATAFGKCAQVDGDGWTVTKVANVTFAESGFIQSLSCVGERAKRIFREIDQLPPFVQTSNNTARLPWYEDEIEIGLTWEQGPLSAFPPSPDRSLRESDNAVDPDRRIMFDIRNVSVLNLTGIECFSQNTLTDISVASEDDENDFIVVDLMCQNATGLNVDFYFGGTVQVVANDTIASANSSSLLTTKKGSVIVGMLFVGRVQFEDEILFNGGHFANVDFFTSLPITGQDFRSIIQRMLYSEASNATLRVPGGDVLKRTLLDKRFIIIGAAEILVVFVFGLVVILYSRFKSGSNWGLNTLDGLSYYWANADSRYRLEFGHKRMERIQLSLSKNEAGKYFWRPERFDEETEFVRGLGTAV